MRSPFDDLGKTREEDSQGELVEGAFSCERDDCYYVATEARYLTANKLITWKCQDGHLSKANINLD